MNGVERSNDGVTLRKCPFCGGEARWATEHKHWIECGVCGVESIYSEHSEDCIKAWNTRKPVERILERLEEEKSDWNDDYNVPINKAIEIIKEEVG